MIFATILYPGNKHGISLGKEAEGIQEKLQQELINKFGANVRQLRAVRYAIYEGFPTSVNSINSNRLAYNVSANMWIYREGARFENPLSGLLKWDEVHHSIQKKTNSNSKTKINPDLAKFLKDIR